VHRFLPSFAGDADKKWVMVKHLICACTGLPADLEWPSSLPASACEGMDGSARCSRPASSASCSSTRISLCAAGSWAARDVPGSQLGAAFDKAMQAKVLG
jgi:hypothetical protein